MKKIMALFLILSLSLTLSACGAKENKNAQTGGKESVAQLKESHSLSLVVTQAINHSVTTCTTVNLLPVFQIKTHFSLPYVNTSHMH